MYRMFSRVRARHIVVAVALGATAVVVGPGARGAGAAVPVPALAARAALQRAQALVPGAARLRYWGGRVVANVRVVTVVWGSGGQLAAVNGNVAPNVSSFFAGITRSSYFDWLHEYDANGTHIGRGSFAGRFTITPSARNNGARVDDLANLRPELLAQLRAGHLPAPDANTLYVVFLRNGQVATQGVHDSVTGFCAYHSATTYRPGVTVRYAVVPASAAGPHCGRSPGLGNLTTALSHEMTEAVTDPDVGLATRLGPPLAWYDPAHGEIGDICAGLTSIVTGADGRRYVVQREWSNRRQACVAS